MKNLPALNFFLFKLSMLLALVCLALENGFAVNLSTDSLSILLLFTWGVMGISLILNLMTYIAEQAKNCLYMLLGILFINIFFFSRHLDSGMNKGISFFIILFAIWMSIVEFLAMKKDEEYK